MPAPAPVCSICKAGLMIDDRFCPQCGQTTARIFWYSSPDVQPREGASAIPDSGTFYLVAQNSGNDVARVFVDGSRLKALTLVGPSEAWVERRQTAAFALQHTGGEVVGGVVVMQSEDGPRPRVSAREPDAPWWQTRGLRQQQYRAQTIVRIVNDRWLGGAHTLLFPPGVRKQYLRIWNDSDRARTFDTDVPVGYKVTLDQLDIDRKSPELGPHTSAELTVQALSDRNIKDADSVWALGPDEAVTTMVRMPQPPTEAGADVVIAIDFGTRNTGIRVRWRHELVVGKPRGSTDSVGDQNGTSTLRFPTEMAMHVAGRSFQWGSDVPRGLLPPNVVRIRNLKTYLRAGEEAYLKYNDQWTNAYLLERYFEQLFVRVDAYFRTIDSGLFRRNLNIRYMLTRPVLDANEGDANGKHYEEALLLAMERSGVARSDVLFVYEPVAAAFGVARQRSAELYSLGEGAIIAIIDAGGGTTDIALAQISLKEGKLSLSIRGAHALHLDPQNPALPAVERYGASDRLELGGDVLDYALTYKLLTDAAALLDTEGRPVPARIEFSTPAADATEAYRREMELVMTCRTLKEAFAFVSTHHLTAMPGQVNKASEQCIFANRPEYEGVYLEHALFGERLIAPILKTPVEELNERMEQQVEAGSGVRPSQVREVFYVGGTDIEFYFRQQLHVAFPNTPRLTMEDPEGVAERIAERLNAVVEGAVWCDEALFAASPIDITLQLDGSERPLLQKGDPLPPEVASPLRPFLVKLEPYQELNALLVATTDAGPFVVARGHYRNASETVLEGTLQLRISQEQGVVARLVIAGGSYDQWRVALVER